MGIENTDPATVGRKEKGLIIITVTVLIVPLIHYFWHLSLLAVMFESDDAEDGNIGCRCDAGGGRNMDFETCRW